MAGAESRLVGSLFDCLLVTIQGMTCEILKKREVRQSGENGIRTHNRRFIVFSVNTISANAEDSIVKKSDALPLSYLSI